MVWATCSSFVTGHLDKKNTTNEVDEVVLLFCPPHGRQVYLFRARYRHAGSHREDNPNATL